MLTIGKLAALSEISADTLRYYEREGGGIPLAATGLIHPIWAMVAMAVSVTAIFINSLWGNPRLFFDAIRSVGRPVAQTLPQGA
jgi:P-type Cu+ transporter